MVVVYVIMEMIENIYFVSASHYGWPIGGVFKLELFLPEEYPMAAPKVHEYIPMYFFSRIGKLICLSQIVEAIIFSCS